MRRRTMKKRKDNKIKNADLLCIHIFSIFPSSSIPLIFQNLINRKEKKKNKKSKTHIIKERLRDIAIRFLIFIFFRLNYKKKISFSTSVLILILEPKSSSSSLV